MKFMKQNQEINIVAKEFLTRALIEGERQRDSVFNKLVDNGTIESIVHKQYLEELEEYLNMVKYLIELVENQNDKR